MHRIIKTPIPHDLSKGKNHHKPCHLLGYWLVQMSQPQDGIERSRGGSFGHPGRDDAA